MAFPIENDLNDFVKYVSIILVSGNLWQKIQIRWLKVSKNV